MSYFDKLELAWAAGFFDGEGWFGYRISKPSYGFVMGVSQKDIRPLIRFKEALQLDTNIHKNRINTIILSGSKAFPATKNLWPFLSEPKKEQAVESFLKGESMRFSGRFKRLDEEYLAFGDFLKNVLV